eukprot:6956746-Prymnesium_polylepis.1
MRLHTRLHNRGTSHAHHIIRSRLLSERSAQRAPRSRESARRAEGGRSLGAAAGLGLTSRDRL